MWTCNLRFWGRRSKIVDSGIVIPPDLCPTMIMQRAVGQLKVARAELPKFGPGILRMSRCEGLGAMGGNGSWLGERSHFFFLPWGKIVDDSRISGYPNEKLYTSSKVGGLLGGDVVRFCWFWWWWQRGWCAGCSIPFWWHLRQPRRQSKSIPQQVPRVRPLVNGQLFGMPSGQDPLKIKSTLLLTSDCPITGIRNDIITVTAVIEYMSSFVWLSLGQQIPKRRSRDDLEFH